MDRWIKRDRKQNHTSKMLKFSYWFQDCFSFIIVSPQSNVNANISAPIWFYECECVCDLRIFESQQSNYIPASLGWNSLSLYNIFLSQFWVMCVCCMCMSVCVSFPLTQSVCVCACIPRWIQEIIASELANYDSKWIVRTWSFCSLDFCC